MATAVRRKKTDTLSPTNLFAEHITLKRQASTITTRSNVLKERLKKWLLEEATPAEVYENEQGSKFFDFPETVSDGKEDFKGMELRRVQPITFNEEEAEKILKRRGVYEEALTPVLDQDKVYRLLQEGKITEKDVDKMFEKKETWSFWPIKGEVI